MGKAEPMRASFLVRWLSSAIALAVAFALATPAHASRILELCDVVGVRPNQLIGYGLVVGLNNTGDSGQARFTLQSTAAMLRRLGATIDPSMIQTRNAAAVMVTATLVGGAAPGSRIDVTVSSLGNARSLAGGTLLQTPLYAADRQVYAVAQGGLTLGGFGATGRSGSTATYNHLTAGRIPEGAIVERPVPGSELPTEGPLMLSLRDPSFINARRIAQAINTTIGDGSARALDHGRVELTVPTSYAQDRVGLLAEVQAIDVVTEVPARVVIDERTGTVVVGAGVRIREVAIAQGGLMVQVNEHQDVSQPGLLAQGQTVVTQGSDIAAQTVPGTLRHVGATTTLEDIVQALNALGATPRDLITIFQALHRAGALDAEIEVQ